MKKIILSTTILASAIFMFNPLFAFGHGEVTTQTKQAGVYNIEFEYDTLGQIVVGDFTTYDVFLLNENKDPVDFDAAFVKISSSNGAVVMLANLKEAVDEAGSARIGGVLKDAGDYKANVQFQKGGSVVASADFNFNVIEKADQKRDYRPLAVVLLIGLALGVVSGYSFRRK